MTLKGVVLAGGSGSRLFPLTLVTNKHLLPVYDRPMIFYPLDTLREMGCREVMVVVGGRSVGDVLRMRAGDQNPGLRFEDKTWTWAEVVEASARRAAWVASVEPLPGSARPRASVRQFIEFAVNMPEHEPQVGQAERSIVLTCSSV